MFDKTFILYDNRFMCNNAIDLMMNAWKVPSLSSQQHEHHPWLEGGLGENPLTKLLFFHSTIYVLLFAKVRKALF